MKNVKIRILLTLVVLFSTCVFVFPEDKKDIEKLLKEIESLRKDVEELKKTKSDKTSNETSTQKNLAVTASDAKTKPIVEKDVKGYPLDFTYNRSVFGFDPDYKYALLRRIQWQVKFWSTLNYVNNTDMRKLDETSDDAITRTDDREMFGYAGAELDLFFPIHPRVDFRMDVWRIGYLGRDNLGGRDSNNNTQITPIGSNSLNFGFLYVDGHLITKPTDKKRLDIRMGRQDYRVGGKLKLDLIQDDNLDSIVIKFYSPLGRLDILALDIFGNATDTSDAYFVSYMSRDNLQTQGFNGNLITYRTGFNYTLDIIGDSRYVSNHITLRTFGYYAKFGGANSDSGGRSTGADRSNLGVASNVPDNDYTTMVGGRLNFGTTSTAWGRNIIADVAEKLGGFDVRASLTYAESKGIDRKIPKDYIYNQDVDNNGKFYSAEVEFAFVKRKLHLIPAYYYVQGGKYLSNGTQYSHGFVSFKGDMVGGLILRSYLGYRTAYTDVNSVYDTPYQRNRKSGFEAYHLTFVVDILRWMGVTLEWWQLRDTNEMDYLTKSNRFRVGSILNGNPLQGNLIESRDHRTSGERELTANYLAQLTPENSTYILANRRFGAPMGEEVNLTLNIRLVDYWRVWITGGIFFPSRYYSTAGLVENAPEGSANPVALQMGTSLTF